MSFVLSLDFGSAYTKVALRHNPDEPSELVKDKTLHLDVLNICIPTVAAARERNGKTDWLCGTQVIKQVSGNGIHVYPNWKPRLFAAEQMQDPAWAGEEGAGIGAVATTRLEGENGRIAPLAFPEGKVTAVLQKLSRLSSERQQLVAEVGRLGRLPIKEVAAVVDAEEMTVAELRALVARLQAQGSAGSNLSPSVKHGVDQIALEYFKWLRGFLQGACQNYDIPEIGQIPVRVCVPAFVYPMSSVGNAARRDRLLNILRQAGWTLDDRYPTVTEPFANGLGVLTQGRNKTWENSRNHVRDIHGPSMFAGSPFLKAIREREGEYVVLVVDVGAFTSDFAVLAFNVKDVEDRPQIVDDSEALGVDLLDQEVQAVLPPEKATALATLDLEQREKFKEIVYRMKPCILGKGMRVGDGQEGERIRNSIASFAARIARRLEAFLDQHGVGQLHEVVLTGGGNQISVVRSTLRDCINARTGETRPVMHLPLTGADTPDPASHRLDTALVRGGSALGGASVYIDYMV